MSTFFSMARYSGPIAAGPSGGRSTGNRTEDPMHSGWTAALTLSNERIATAGSADALAVAVGRGADLRVYTEFLFEEHVAAGGDGDPADDGLMREVIDFRET